MPERHSGTSDSKDSSKKTNLIAYLVSIASMATAALFSSPTGRELVAKTLHLSAQDPAFSTAHRDVETQAPPPGLPEPAPHSENAQLLTEHTPGWEKPAHAVLAVPTWAPAMVAFGIVFLALGVVTKWPLSVLGGLLFVIAIVKWMKELLHA